MPNQLVIVRRRTKPCDRRIHLGGGLKPRETVQCSLAKDARIQDHFTVGNGIGTDQEIGLGVIVRPVIIDREVNALRAEQPRHRNKNGIGIAGIVIAVGYDHVHGKHPPSDTALECFHRP
jgi:hypothetical protein